MAHLIDKDKIVAELERRIKRFREEKDSVSIVKTNTYKGLLSFIDTLEVKEVDLTDIKTEWSPSKKQMKSFKDLLNYNIGVFDYQKFMEVTSLYDDLAEIFDYETINR